MAPAAAPSAATPPSSAAPAAAPTVSESEAPPARPRPEPPSRAGRAGQERGAAPRARPSAEPEPPRPLPQERPAGTDSSDPQAESSQPEEDFGRWQRNTRQCEIQLPDPEEGETPRQPLGQGALACRSVRLDQQLAGLLSIRFLQVTTGRGNPAQQLLLAGVLLPGSQPMRCRNSRCEPTWPMRVQLSALATSNVGTLGLPQARVVQGNCSLERSRLVCTARDHEGMRWQVKAHW